MRRRIIYAVLIAMLGAALMGCASEKDDRSVIFQEEEDTGAGGEEAELPVIPEDSRQVVAWRLPYDWEAGELSDIFIVAFNEENEDTAAIIDELKNSESCGEALDYYSFDLQYYAEAEVYSQDYMDWYKGIYPEEYDGFCDRINRGEYRASLDVISHPGQTETVLTMPWILEGSGSYEGDMIFELYAGDEIVLSGLDEETDSRVDLPVTIDRVTMDAPWYVNEYMEIPCPVLIVSWEEYLELAAACNKEQEADKPDWYIFRDQGEDQELHEMARQLRKEYTGKDQNSSEMCVYEQQLYFK